MSVQFVVGEGELRFEGRAIRGAGISSECLPARADPAIEPTTCASADARLKVTFNVCLSYHRLGMAKRIMMS